MSELWKPICGYGNQYTVSNMGRIKNLVSNRILKPQRRRHGYLSVWLYNNKSRKQVSIHRLVADAFCERTELQIEVNHLNEDKTDNRAENLAWCTKKENCSYGNRPSTISRKNTNGKRSKPVRQYTMSGELVKEYPSIHEVRRQTGFGEGNIHHAISGKYSQAYGFRWQYAI